MGGRGAPPTPQVSRSARDDERASYLEFATLTSCRTVSMDKPARCSLLPGVLDVRTPPAVVFESHKVIARARRRAAFRDVFNLLLLACVDGLFLRWPRAHVPSLDRADSLLLMVALNALLIGYIWLARSMPRWNARRVASTWCVAERSRLTSSPRR